MFPDDGFHLAMRPPFDKPCSAGATWTKDEEGACWRKTATRKRSTKTETEAEKELF